MTFLIKSIILCVISTLIVMNLAQAGIITMDDEQVHFDYAKAEDYIKQLWEEPDAVLTIDE